MAISFLMILLATPGAPIAEAKEAPEAPRPLYTPHSPITIMSDSQFTPENGVVGGTGTEDDPYIIANLEIDATGSPYGIGVFGTTAYFRIENCSITGGTMAAINIWYAEHFLGVRNCVIQESHIGIGFTNCTDTTLEDCTLSDCMFGIWIFNTTKTETYVRNCTMSLALLADGGGGEGPSFPIGILVFNSHMVYVENCTVIGMGLEASSVGAGVFYGQDVEFKECKFTDLSAGIFFMNQSSEIRVESCIIEHCRTLHDGEEEAMPAFAIGVGNSSYADIIGNQISDCDIGIFLANSTYNRVEQCVIEGTSMGMLFMWVNRTLVEYNDIIGGQGGIWLATPSYYNTLRYNIVAYQEMIALNITGSNNVLYHNDFVENGKMYGSQAYDVLPGNTWYNTSLNEGNYWSDHTTPDADEDGIVDVPYPIAGPAGSQDPYPLASPVRFQQDTLGPNITDVSWSPASPQENQQVTITVRVSDPSGVDTVILKYRTDTAWVEVQMSYAGDDTYSATVPGQPAGTTVHFKIWANDTLGNHNETSEYSYTVSAIPDTEGPSISDITATPSQPKDGEDITVRARVSDPSGVKTVILSYSTDGGQTWHNITMTSAGDDYYEATIPGQPGGTTVRYKIYACDNADNWSISEEKTVKIIAKPWLEENLVYVAAGAAAVGVVIAIAVFFLLKK